MGSESYLPSHVRTVAAYRDRYEVTAKTHLGPAPDRDVQKVAAARAAAALARLRDIVTQTSEPGVRRAHGRDRSGLVR